MTMRAFLAGCVCLGICQLSAEEKGIRLQFLPGTPVVQTSKLEFERKDQFPGLNLNENATQRIESVITLSGDAEFPLCQLPVDFTYVLKGIDVDLILNKIKRGYKTTDPHIALKKLLDFPLKLRLNSGNKVESAYSHLLFNLPVLGEINLENFFNEWFQHVFALSGKELFVGFTYKISSVIEDKPSTFHYTILSIDENHIKAAIQGSISSKKIKIPENKEFRFPKHSDAELAVEAKVEGEVCWNRKNALICQHQTRSTYQGKFQIEDQSWNLEMTLKHQFDSCEKCVSKSE